MLATVWRAVAGRGVLLTGSTNGFLFACVLCVSDVLLARFVFHQPSTGKLHNQEETLGRVLAGQEHMHFHYTQELPMGSWSPLAAQWFSFVPVHLNIEFMKGIYDPMQPFIQG